MEAIVAGDTATASSMLAGDPGLATAREPRGATRQDAQAHFFDAIGHYIYGGDTALHMAAAGYRVEIIKMLLDAGAEVDAANRRGAQPLHYAADTALSRPNWDPRRQAQGITMLIEAGADPNVLDKSGVAPLQPRRSHPVRVRRECVAGRWRRPAAAQQERLDAVEARVHDDRSGRIGLPRGEGAARRNRAHPRTPRCRAVDVRSSRPQPGRGGRAGLCRVHRMRSRLDEAGDRTDFESEFERCDDLDHGVA